MEELGSEMVLKSARRGERGRGEDRREKEGRSGAWHCSPPKAQHRTSKAPVLQDSRDPVTPQFLPVCFLLSVCSSCFDLLPSPSRLNVLQELPCDGKK